MWCTCCAPRWDDRSPDPRIWSSSPRAVERTGPNPQGTPFRVTNSEADHGEDVKEYYFYIDSTPTRSYIRYRILGTCALG